MLFECLPNPFPDIGVQILFPKDNHGVGEPAVSRFDDPFYPLVVYPPAEIECQDDTLVRLFLSTAPGARPRKISSLARKKPASS
jgi:hypothetical protein